MRAILKDKDQWIRAMSLDPQTGLDPPGVKVRSAQGFDAASYFITGYFIVSLPPPSPRPSILLTGSDSGPVCDPLHQLPCLLSTKHTEIIENLAALDYDQSDMFLAAYDWRLSYYNLEVKPKSLTNPSPTLTKGLQIRDHYFSRLVSCPSVVFFSRSAR